MQLHETLAVGEAREVLHACLLAREQKRLEQSEGCEIFLRFFLSRRKRKSEFLPDALAAGREVQAGVRIRHSLRFKRS